jgi:hypothetical protein
MHPYKPEILILTSIHQAYWVLLALLHGKIFEFPENVRAHAEATQALKSFASFLSRAEVSPRP